MSRHLVAHRFLRLIAILALVAMSGCGSHIPTAPYSTMLAEIKAGNVDRVELYINAATVHFKQTPNGFEPGVTQCHVMLPKSDREQEELKQLLEERGVAFQYLDASRGDW